MVFVDFADPSLRRLLVGGEYLAGHEEALGWITASIGGWTKRKGGREGCPLAAAVDIDEVVLSNIHMNSCPVPGDGVFHACDYFLAPDGRPWPRDDLRLNPLLPGARRLITELRRLGVAVFFVTGRLESLRSETVENFVHVGLAGESEEDLLSPGDLACPPSPRGRAGAGMFMRPGEDTPVQPYKEQCRERISRTHRIILNVGDQESDMGRFAENQVLVPNPFYRIL
jgi:predicted secreted acid phosphatase